MRISLAGPSYTSQSVVAAAQQTMNLIPEAVEVPNEPARLVLYGRPGIQSFVTLPQANIRCLWGGGGRLFAIAGTAEIEIHSDGSTTQWSNTIATSSGAPVPDPAQIFSNGNQLMIVAGGLVYCDNGSGAQLCHFQLTGNGNVVSGALIWTSGPQFQASWVGMPINIDDGWYTVQAYGSATELSITPAPPNATNIIWTIAAGAQVDGVTGGFLDGYFLVNRVPTPGVSGDPGRQFNISNLMDGTQWNPLMFGVKEAGPDYIKSILADHEELWLFGHDTIEIWSNVGDPNFPFQRIPGAFIRDGSIATFAPCSVGLSVCYLGGGHDGQTMAFQAKGLQPARISTHAQEQVWNQPNFKVSDVVSYGYAENGHIFWVLNFWQMGVTWVYDLNEGLWHERAAWNPSTRNFTRYLPWFHAFIPEWGTYGVHIVGDPATGKLYKQSVNYYLDDTAEIEYLRAFPHLINENQYHYDHRLEVLMETGILSSTDPYPAVGLDWSDDHGHTFNDAISRSRSIGPTGNYTQRVFFNRLGRSRDRIYRVGILAQTKVAIIDTYLEITQGFA